MKGKIVLENGKEFELTEEQIKVICEAEKPAKLTGWERLEYEKTFWYITDIEINADSEENASIDDEKYKQANYFSTKEKAEEVAFETELFRKLKRFADENNDGVIDWKNALYRKYMINMTTNYTIGIESTTYRQEFGQVYFTSKEIAEKALETFRPELEKYYGINQK